MLRNIDGPSETFYFFISGAAILEKFCQMPGMPAQFRNRNSFPPTSLQHWSYIKKIFCWNAPPIDYPVSIIHFESDPGRVLFQVAFLPQLDYQRYCYLVDIAVGARAVDHAANLQFPEMIGMPFPYPDRYVALIHLTPQDVSGYRLRLAGFEQMAQA